MINDNLHDFRLLVLNSSQFKPAWWLSNPHIQTIYSSLTRHLKAPIDKTERLELPDRDFIDLAWAINGLKDDSPLVIFLHGLGGSVHSTYVAGQLHAYNRAGWRGVLMHFRGASATPNRLPRAYHSGETEDLNFVLNTLAAREPNTKKSVVGVSLGGNVLLKWLGEQQKQSLIHAAVAISVPFQLDILATHMNQGFSKLYQTHLLNKLATMFQQKYTYYPDIMPDYFNKLKIYRSFWSFDEHVTAPLHGFSSAKDYYQASSSRQFLKNIKTPTLILHALDDPFMTPLAVPKPQELSSYITFELSAKGGHVGFITGKIPGKAHYWLDKRVPEFLKLYIT
jgi:predicted alpha/beta-fold hydrolase